MEDCLLKIHQQISVCISMAFWGGNWGVADNCSSFYFFCETYTAYSTKSHTSETLFSCLQKLIKNVHCVIYIFRMEMEIFLDDYIISVKKKKKTHTLSLALNI